MENKKYRVLLEDAIDPHFRPNPPQEIYSSDNREDCENFCWAYAKDNKGFYGLRIQKQEMRWVDV